MEGREEEGRGVRGRVGRGGRSGGAEGEIQRRRRVSGGQRRSGEVRVVPGLVPAAVVLSRINDVLPVPL